MKSRISLLAALSLASTAGLAGAQDSVSKTNGLPGDAVNPHLAGEQINNYVLETTAFRSSWDNVYSAAPLVKSSLDFEPPAFFNMLISGNAISECSLDNVPFARSSYSLWNGPGFGVNDDSTRNDPGAPVNTSNFTGRQFAAALAEFGGGSNNNVISAVVNYEPEVPSRLYVSRVVSAVNSDDYGACNLAQVGFGGIDADGNVHFRVDDFGTDDFSCGAGLTAITGNNLFRVDNLSRNGAVQNTISLAGGSDAGATDWLLALSGVTHNTPTLIPETVAGRPILIGTNFNTEYVFESAAGVLSTTGTHLAGAANDQRGNLCYTRSNFPSLFPASTLGTTGHVAHDAGGSATLLNLFGLGANGSVAGPALPLSLPNTLVDNKDGAQFGAGSLEFDHYHSQVAFRGGNGQVAIGRDKSGNMIVAAEVDHPSDGGSDWGNNLIAVARVTPQGQVAWTVAGHCTGATGKAILDGSGTPIGRMVSLLTVTGGGASPVNGPSVSAPMIDSVGNVYFLAAIEVFGAQASDFGVGLLKAVYDPASFSYCLELILETGDVLRGANSTRDYQLRFIGIADSNSIDSGTCFSGNINQDALAGANPANLDEDESATLGGLVINCQIIYDNNADGMFVISTGQNGDPNSPDEDYRVLLYVQGGADCNDNGVPDDRDIADGTSQDTDGNGVPDECAPVEPGVQSCFGVGCPCANDDPTAGCANSSGQGGLLAGSGSTSLGSDDLILDATQLPPNNNGLFYMGNVQVFNPSFFDGFQCALGQSFRFLCCIQNTGATGTMTLGPGINGLSGGLITPGSTWNFHAWFRDVPGSPCGTGANLTNLYSVTFTP